MSLWKLCRQLCALLLEGGHLYRSASIKSERSGRHGEKVLWLLAEFHRLRVADGFVWGLTFFLEEYLVGRIDTGNFLDICTRNRTMFGLELSSIYEKLKLLSAFIHDTPREAH